VLLDEGMAGHAHGHVPAVVAGWEAAKLAGSCAVAAGGDEGCGEFAGTLFADPWLPRLGLLRTARWRCMIRLRRPWVGNCAK